MPSGVDQDGASLALYDAIFPARLTAVEEIDGVNVYSFTEQMLDVDDEYTAADLAREGVAQELNNRLLAITDPGELVWMRFRTVDEGGEEYEFYAGVDASTPYGDLAGLQSTDCLTATGPSDSVVLTYSGGVWVSEDALTYPGDTGIVRFWFAAGSLHCSLETTNCGARELLDLGNGCFRGGQLTGHIVGDGAPCAGETFEVCVACSECAFTPGWYCVDESIPGPTGGTEYDDGSCVWPACIDLTITTDGNGATHTRLLHLLGDGAGAWEWTGSIQYLCNDGFGGTTGDVDPIVRIVFDLHAGAGEHAYTEYNSTGEAFADDPAFTCGVIPDIDSSALCLTSESVPYTQTTSRVFTLPGCV